MQIDNSGKTITNLAHSGKDLRKGSKPTLNLEQIWQRLGLAIAVIGSWGIADTALAQVTTDGTLPTEVNRNGAVWEITGGERPENGDNLFHSFGEFSLLNGDTAFFNNATDIVNIIGRVTGGNLSAIDGLIRANGGANLILLNPAGISFGANARLDLGGSFLGSSAESLTFEDGGTFSATNTDNSILTVSAPIGLQMGQGSGAISVAGTGNQITETDLSSPLDLGNNPGLEVSSGKTLALVGNQLIFDGGIVTAEGGAIALGSVAEGEVALDADPRTGWSLSYDNVTALSEVRLNSAAMANASSGTPSIPGGSIQVQGSRVSLNDGSSMLIQNTAPTATGSINVFASEAVTLQGSNESSTNNSNIVNEPLAAGSGGNINIDTPNLSLADGAFISTTAYGSGKGGDIDLDATDSISLVGRGLPELIQTFQAGVLNKTLQPSDRGTGLFIGTAGSGASGALNLKTGLLRLANGSIIHSPIFTEGLGGDINIDANRIELDSSAIQAGAVQESIAATVAGNINIDTTELDIRDGAVIIDLTLGAAAGGDINLNAETIELQNSPPTAAFLTGIYANSSVGSGTAGDIEIKTERLSIDDAFISNSSGLALLDNTTVRAGGTGGNIAIDASEIDVRGIPFDPAFSSGIGSTTFSDSNAGNISITTDRLSVADGGDITTTTLGGGAGGDLIINASEYIDVAGTTMVGNMRRGGLFAASGRASFPDLVATGEAGAIEIYTPDLTIRDGASIDVQSFGTGGTGELNVVADSIAIDNQGAITAETQSGVGGNIFLEADNVFWRRQSTTTASAGGSGDGGNIIIEADNLVALEDSRLIADAAAGGDGGNILVNTQSLFICPSCQVSASSTLGVDGIVTFNVLEPETNLESTELPEQPALPEEVVALACSSQPNQQASELTIVGRGGLPPRPSEPLNSESLISFSPAEDADEITPTVGDSELPAPASGWYINAEGTVVLAARSLNPASNSRFNTADCRVP